MERFTRNKERDCFKTRCVCVWVGGGGVGGGGGGWREGVL